MKRLPSQHYYRLLYTVSDVRIAPGDAD